MLVEIWSDVVCPWCYIGKRRFEKALANYARADEVTVIWRPYQLDPSAPRDGATPVKEAYARKFGGTEQATAIINKVTAVAAESGLDFNMDIALRANTCEAHRLLWLAERQYGNAMQNALKERLLRAYFMEGRNVGDHATLIELGAEVGLDAVLTAEFLDSDAGLNELAIDLQNSAAAGITAVPTYVFNGQWTVPGAQEPEFFVRALTRLHELEAQAALDASTSSDAACCDTASVGEGCDI